jgi:transaldolase
VNTMPEATLRAFADHGRLGEPLRPGTAAADATLAEAAGAGIDLPAITADLERAGVRSFCDSYGELLDRIDGMVAAG